MIERMVVINSELCKILLIKRKSFCPFIDNMNNFNNKKLISDIMILHEISFHLRFALCVRVDILSSF